MNDILKIGVLWILISIPMMWYFKPTVIRSFIVCAMGIILISIGFIINEYQCWKEEKNFQF